MLLKIQLICCLALLAKAQNSIEQQSMDATGEIHFETSHKRPDENDFQTSHKIPRHSFLPEADMDLLQGTMNLLPTKERPELNPVLSALINEDVMKSIEAKRAIEKEELEQIKAELDAARELREAEEEESQTEANYAVLTTAAPIKKAELDEDFNVGFVDQSINLDAAGSENNKKSRIEIKKGPNGQDYEYEYVYYYEDEDDAKPSEAPTKADSSERGKSRYSNIERTTAAPASNSIVSSKTKGRSSSLADADDVEAERLPANTRFPSRGKNADAQPTPASDSLENAAEKKKISVKRPSLELVDSATFNTDEKQVKGIRNSDTETKSAIAIEQEQAAAAAAAEKKEAEEKQRRQPTVGSDEENVTVKDVEDEEVEQTTLSMEKAALDLYAILQNENFNMDMTTDADTEVTTMLPDTTNSDDDVMTTLVDEEPSSTTTTTTTTTTEATTTTTTTTTTPAPTLFGGKRAGLNSAGRNRFKLNKGGKSEASTTTTTEAAPAEAPKTGKNRFSRPPIGGRARPGARTTTAAPAAAAAEEEEEVAAPKEVKPVSSGFGRGRPRNRFNLRSTTTTEKSASADGEEANEEAPVSSTTARSLRGGRPQLGLRGRSRTTTAKPAAADDEHKEEEAAASAAEEKPAPAPARPASRFARPGANRLLPRGKLARTTEAPSADDSAADSSHHNDVKGDENGEENAEKAAEAEAKPAPHHGLNRLKTRPQLHKTEKPKAAPAPAAPRKVNPLLAKRRLQLGHSTTEAPAEEDNATAAEESKTEEESAPAADAPAAENAEADAKEESADDAETTTKQQARGLGLLTQRRRLPLRKPGTIL